MKTADVFPSKFLNAEDHTFDNGEVTVTIKGVSLESMKSRNGPEQDKPVMYFRELAKGLVMNKTNWNTCAKLFGSDDSDDWTGQKVIMNAIETVSFGETVKGIRISDRKPVTNKQDVLDGYAKIFSRAKEVGVEGVDNYAINPNMETQEILELGKDLKRKIASAELFA